MDKPMKQDEKACPFCAETIKAAAVKCRYCQSDLTGTTPPSAIPPDVATEAPPPPARRAIASEDVLVPPAPAPQLGVAQVPSRDVPLLASVRLLGILVTLCLVLVCVAGYAFYRSENPGQGTSPSGVITSSQARDAGMQAATTLTQKVLSYDWKTLDADIMSSEAVLAPSFRSEYATTMGKVKAQTIKNQVKLTAAVVAASIISASASKVVALVFVNQVTTAKGARNQRLDQNRVRVTLTRDGGGWRVSKMDAF